jgi:uncharacterized protein (TIRG00374 family)
MKRIISRLLRPSVVLPVVFSVAILGALLTFANSKKVLSLMESYPHRDLAYYLLVMVGYELVRGLQWHVMLSRLNLRVSLSAQIFSFAIGEITKSLPIGNYTQNYVLQEAEGADIGRTSAATTIIILIEVAVSLCGVVVLGLGQWTGWLRPVIIIGVLVVSIAAATYMKLHHAHNPPRWMVNNTSLRKLLDELRQFRQGAAELLHVRFLIVPTALTTVYLVLAGTALYLVARGLGVQGLSYREALSVYFFSLAFSLIFPLPVDIGVAELSGVGAMLAVGVDRDQAVSVMLLNRVLSIGSAIAIALVVVAILHNELKATLQGRAERKHRQAEDERHSESPPREEQSSRRREPNEGAAVKDQTA